MFSGEKVLVDLRCDNSLMKTTLIQRNWLLGYRIASEELQGEDRAKYGAEIIKKLAKELSAEYGKGYTKSNLYSFYSFYKTCLLYTSRCV